MQVLLTWKAENLNESEAVERWQTITARWQATYQPLVDQELCWLTNQSGNLFLGLLTVPNLFRAWQAFQADAEAAVAWVGLAHNLLDLLRPEEQAQPARGFRTRLQAEGDAFLRELDGHFVAALLDREQQTLRVMVNNTGCVQCFWTTGRYGTALGTRMTPLLDLVDRPRVPCRAGVIHTLALGMNFGPQSIYEGVTRLEPGHEAILRAAPEPVQIRCHTPFTWILDKRNDFGKDYLPIGSDFMIATLKAQFRHADAPLMNLTGGMDSRVLVATAVALGHHPDCDVSGLPEWREIKIASQAADALGVKLHRIFPEPFYADQLEQTLHLWSLWTEGLSSVGIGFSRAAFALTPQLRQFFAPYRQRFSGLAGELGRNASWGTEMLLETPSLKEIYAGMKIKYSNEYFSKADRALIHQTAWANLTAADQMGLRGSQLINYFIWNELCRRGGGAILDVQHFGRYVFASFNYPTLTAVFFAMTPAEKLACAWHQQHLRRLNPALLEIPFLKPPLWTPDGALTRDQKLQQAFFRFNPGLYKAARHVKDALLTKYGIRYVNRHEDKAGAYFQPYVQQLLFAGDPWWPTVLDYKQGKRMWERFVTYQECMPIWALVSLELWAKNFLMG